MTQSEGSDFLLVYRTGCFLFFFTGYLCCCCIVFLFKSSVFVAVALMYSYDRRSLVIRLITILKKIKSLRRVQMWTRRRRKDRRTMRWRMIPFSVFIDGSQPRPYTQPLPSLPLLSAGAYRIHLHRRTEEPKMHWTLSVPSSSCYNYVSNMQICE